MSATVRAAVEREAARASRRVSWSTVRQIVWAEAESVASGWPVLGALVAARSAKATVAQSVTLDDLRSLELELLPGLFGGES